MINDDFKSTQNALKFWRCWHASGKSKSVGTFSLLICLIHEVENELCNYGAMRHKEDHTLKRSGSEAQTLKRSYA